MTQPRTSDSRLQVRAANVKPGDFLNTHQDVFWEVLGVAADRHVEGQLKIQLAHGRQWIGMADCLVWIEVRS